MHFLNHCKKMPWFCGDVKRFFQGLQIKIWYIFECVKCVFIFFQPGKIPIPGFGIGLSNNILFQYK